MKIKFCCSECDQRVLVPSKAIGKTTRCPRCDRELVVPKGYTSSVTALVCDCGVEHPAGTARCGTCGLDMWTTLADAAKASAGDPPPSSLLVIPDGYVVAPAVKLKFSCECGKRVKSAMSRAGSSLPCPGCGKPLVAPFPGDLRVLEYQCECGSEIGRGQSLCPACKADLFVLGATEISTSPPPVAPALPAPLAAPAEAPPPAPASEAVAALPKAPIVALDSVPMPPPVPARPSPQRARRPGWISPLALMQLSLTVLFLSMAAYFVSQVLRTKGTAPPTNVPPSQPPATQVPTVAPRIVPGDGSAPAVPELTTPTGSGGSGAGTAPGSNPPDTPVPVGSGAGSGSSATTPEDEARALQEALDRALGKTPPPKPDGSDIEKGLGEVLGRPKTPYQTMMSVALPARPAKVAPVEEAEAPGGEPDFAYFTKHVQPVLKAGCLKCHGQEFLPTGQLKLSDKDANARANFKAVLAFVDRQRPSRSMLVRKPLAIADGGAAHGGGEQLRRTSPEYGVLLTFARGAALGQPTAAIAPLSATETGKTVALDGAASADPAATRLTHAWGIVFAPDGSAAAIDGPTKPKATLTPDRAGVYVIELVVTNAAKSASAPARAHVVVQLPSAAVATEAPTGDALAAKRRVVATLFDQLLGRSPTDTERARAIATPVRRLVWELFRRPESWRRWLANEANHYDLAGPFAPTPALVADLEVQLANRTKTPSEALGALLLDGAFTRRFPAPGDRARALFLRRLGTDLTMAEHAAMRTAATAIAAGDTGTLFAERAGGMEGLVRGVFAQRAGDALFLERYHLAMVGKVPDQPAIDRWVERMRGDPHGFEEAVADWAEAPGYGADAGGAK